MPFDYNKVKHILVCPQTKAELVHDDTALVSTDPLARLSYPILDEIPRLLVEESSELTSEDWAEVMKRHNRSQETGQPI